MSQGNTFGPGPYSTPDGTPPKRGMSTGLKVLLILGGLFGLLTVLCCGGVFYFVNKVANAFTNDPAQIAAIQEEVIDIETPPGVAPQSGLDVGFFGFEVKMAIYAGERNEMLMIMQMPGMVTEAEMRQKMDENFQKQGRKKELEIQSREVRRINIDGQEVPFEFATGTDQDSGETIRMVTGTFPGRGGTAMLLYIVRESEWDEEEVMTMLRSIRK